MSVSIVRKGDTVIARRGTSIGKIGKVLEVLPKRGRAIVEGLHLVKKNLRKTEETPKGGVVEKESPIPLSNLMLYCPNCKKGVRVSREEAGGKGIRKCKRCEHSFDG